MKEQNLGRGHHIVGFDSMEELLAYRDEQERTARSDALDEQWQIGWGDRVIRVVDDLWIFGHIFTQEEHLADNQTEGYPDVEIMEELDGIRDAHTRGYRYGKWYSEVEPEGEYGSAHIVSLWRITIEDFEQARERGWSPSPELAFRVGQEVGDARIRKESE